jgi:hypothetical protein
MKGLRATLTTAVVDSLKTLEPNRPIREVDISRLLSDLCLNPQLPTSSMLDAWS